MSWHAALAMSLMTRDSDLRRSSFTRELKRSSGKASLAASWRSTVDSDSPRGLEGPASNSVISSMSGMVSERALVYGQEQSRAGQRK
jgi:hypothetical protein